jgi:Ca2+:H+ antiporter
VATRAHALTAFAGVVVLHLLLIPGVSFIVGGARVLHQDLMSHVNELNHTRKYLAILL